MNQAVVVFTRIPEAGRTKTRLMPYLKPEECAGLHMAFLQDLSEALTDTIADVFVAHTGGGPNEGAFRELFPGAQFFEQEGDGLGERMYNALSRAMSVGYERCILIGTDVPYADKVDFNRAFTILREKDYVLGPTEDGGYWLIGARAGEERMMKPLFSLGEYSHSEVLQDTLEMIPSWKSYGLLEEKWDIDTIEDLLLFRESAKGHSGEYLKKHHVISVIVPVYNEVALVQPFVKNLERLEGRCEIIFVDGGSSDGTRAVLREAEAESGGKIRFLESTKGRGTQLNIGAEAANGDILFFLHIDAELPEHPVDEILSVMEKVDAGCFGIRFRSRNFFMWTNKVISNRRAAKGIIFGDQGLFIKREVFYEAGMFPEIPIMEDYQFALTLQEMGVATAMTENTLLVSDRRYRGSTIRKLMVMKHMANLRKRYRAGEDPVKLFEEYPDIR